MKPKEKNKDIKFMEYVAQTEFRPDQFVDRMENFSQFVTYADPDYVYNETYFLNFCKQYIKFQSWMSKKYNSYFDLIKDIVFHNYDNFKEIKLDLILDQTWKILDGEFSVAEKIRFDLVCSDKIQVKVRVFRDSKEYLFLQSYEIKEIQEKCPNDVRKWVEETLNDERYQKHSSLQSTDQ